MRRFIITIGIAAILLSILHENPQKSYIIREHSDSTRKVCSSYQRGDHSVSSLLLMLKKRGSSYLKTTKRKLRNTRDPNGFDVVSDNGSYPSSEGMSLSGLSEDIAQVHSHHYYIRTNEGRLNNINNFNFNNQGENGFLTRDNKQFSLCFIILALITFALRRQHETLSVLLLVCCLTVPKVTSQACGTGQYYDSASSQCKSCSPGTYEQSNYCMPCTFGKYSPSSGSLYCFDCGFGYYCPEWAGSTRYPCGNGQYTYISTASTSNECHKCSPGQSAGLGASSCYDCPAGTSNPSMGGTCGACSPGYSSYQGSYNCYECPSGTYAPNYGSSSCYPCPGGYFSPSYRSTSCTQCNPGYSASPGSYTCYPCRAGTYAPTGASYCIPTSTGYYSTGDFATTQTPCPAGSYQNETGKTSCILCSAGYVAPTQGTSNCAPCNPGTYFINTLTSCKSCDPGFYQNVALQTNCLECQPGTYSNSGAPTCTNCSGGYYNTAVKSSNCSMCPAGTFSVPGSINCTDCQIGTYANAGSGQCTNCSTGTYNTIIKATSCLNCTPGTFQNQSGTDGCLDCPAGTSSLTGAPSCTNCSVGKYSPVSKSTSCTSCTPGTFQNQSGSIDCLDCPAGSSSGTAASSCTKCGVGTYAPTTKSTSCFSCPTGSYQTQIGSSSCDDCPVGTSSATGATLCTSCGVGTYAPTIRSSSCFPCSPGTFQTQTASSSCVNCPAGKSSVSGATSCTNCTIGNYSPVPGSTCLGCPSGTYQNQVGSTVCIPCAIGFYSPVGQSACTPCSKGSSQNQTGQGTCALCGKGFYQNLTQQENCIQCAKDTIASSPGTIDCTPCSAGFVSKLFTYDKCLYRGVFDSQADFLASPVNANCFINSVLVKPLMFYCRRAYMPYCCDGSTPFTNVSCNLILQLTAGDYDYSNYCSLCPFYDKTACPPSTVCWDDGTDELRTNFTVTCLETVAPYCNSRIKANPNDLECFVFTNSCYSEIANSSYGKNWGIFTINFTRRIASTIPSCKDIINMSMTPPYYFEKLVTCSRSSDYSIDVNISLLSSPISFFYLTHFVKDACGFNISSAVRQNITPPVDLGKVEIFGSTNDKCMNLFINSTSTKSYRWSEVSQFWNITYQNTTGVHSETIERISTLGDYKSKFTIMDYDLFSNKILSIYSKILTPYGLNITSNTLTITVPAIASGKTYCGACQLRNRANCNNYDKVCWESYANYKVFDPFNTTTCLKSIAKECYKIWLDSKIDDPQCLDFMPYYNITMMRIKPTLISAKYSSTGEAITLTFNDSIYTDDFTDCSVLFASNTLKWLPTAKSGRWTSNTTLQVYYDPQVGILMNLTLLGNVLHYDYIYTQEYVDSITIPIVLPPLACELKISGIKTVSDCDTIELYAVQVTRSLFPLVFKWDFEYNYTALDSGTQNALMTYLGNYAIFSNQNKVTLPSQYLVRGTIVKVTLYAKSAIHESNIISTFTEVSVKGGAVGVKFSSKTQLIYDLDGSINNRLPIEISNKKCVKDASDSAGTIPVEVYFQIGSSIANLNIATQTVDESGIAATVNRVYKANKALIISNINGFEYIKYYNVTAVIIDLLTQATYTDSIGIRIIKPPITAVIDSIGALVSTSSDIQLNGANSIIPIPTGDTLDYRWKCVSSSSIALGGTCYCPYLDDSNMVHSRITLPKNLLKGFCIYTFALNLGATNNDFRRTARIETQFITFPGAAIPLKGKMLSGSNENITDIYFTFTMPGDSIKDSEIPFLWSLLEVISEDPSSSVSYSMKNTFIYDFFSRTLNQSIDPRIKQGNVPIPSNYTPTYLTPDSVRVLGLDRNSLVPQYRYTFSVTVLYPNAPSFLFVEYLAPPLPRKRDLTIFPMKGVGFQTEFKITFTLSSSTGKDEAQYQIFKRNCPSNKTSLTTVTQIFSMTNSYTTVFSPGDKSCNYEIEIIVRTFEYDGKIDSSLIITVEEQKATVSEVMNAQIDKLNSTDSLPFDQRISLLSEVSSTPVVEASERGAKIAAFIIDQLSTLDSSSGSSIELMNLDEKKSMLSTGASIIASLTIKQKPNIDVNLASVMRSKLDSYLVEVETQESGSYIIPSTIAALSGIADIGIEKQNDAAFFASMQKSITKLKDIMLNDMPPGGPPYIIESPAINIFSMKKYSSDFDNNQSFSTPKGISLALPGNLQNQLFEDLTSKLNDPVNITRLLIAGFGKSIGNSTITIGSSITDTTFNPFKNIKSNAIIDNKTLGNSTTSIVKPEAITNIYSDLNSGRLKDVVNTKEMDNPLMQFSLSPFDFNKSAVEIPFKKSLALGLLPFNQTAQFVIPAAKALGDYINSTIVTPLYYLADKQVWINENCTLKDLMVNVTAYSINCSSIGSRTIQTIDSAISLTVDIIKDIFKVISAGNYRQLANINYLASTGSRTMIAYAVIIGAIILIVSTELYLKKKDKQDLYVIKYKVLHEHFNKQSVLSHTGVLSKIFSFLVQTRRSGVRKITKKSQDTVSQAPASSPALVKKDKKPNKEKVESHNGITSLTPDEEESLKDLYDLYQQCSMIYTDEEIEEVLREELELNVVLNRITKLYIDDEIIKQPVTFTSLLKFEHPIISAFARPEITTPRTIKFLILMCAFLGELFVTGYFYDSTTDNLSSEDVVGRTAIYSIAAALLMIPLTIMIALFLKGAIYQEEMTRSQIETAEYNSGIFRTVGMAFAIFWYAACLYCIAMYIVSFSEENLIGWIQTYFISFSFDTLVVFQLKVLFKVAFAYFIFKIVKTRLLLTAVGVIASKIVDKIIAFL